MDKAITIKEIWNQHLAALKKQGKKITEQQEAELLSSIKENYPCLNFIHNL